MEILYKNFSSQKKVLDFFSVNISFCWILIQHKKCYLIYFFLLGKKYGVQSFFFYQQLLLVQK